MASGEDWSLTEVEAIVADYRHMLTLELSGKAYNKSHHRRILLGKLDNRSESAIEKKLQNISAVMRDLGRPWVRGYKPLSRYQQALFECVATQIVGNEQVEQIIESVVHQPVMLIPPTDFDRVVVDAPKMEEAPEKQPEFVVRARRAIRRNYLVEEAQNRSLGQLGERFVVELERARLHKAGEAALSKRVEQVSETKGDGLGFDVLSFNKDGTERFIEVKTTTFGKEVPFYVTSNELSLSRERPKEFHLYRLFEFRDNPKMFSLSGPISDFCRLDPVAYRASF